MNVIFRFIAGVFGGNSPSPPQPVPSLAPLPIAPAPAPAPVSPPPPPPPPAPTPAPAPAPAPKVEKNQDQMELINSAEFADILGVNLTTFNRYRKKGVILPGIEISERITRWPMSDVNAWLATGPRLSREYRRAFDHRRIRALLDSNQRPEA